MSVSSGRSQLASAFKTLGEHWEETRQKWRDAVREDFARHHYQPLASRVPEVLTALDALDQVLGRIRRECGDADDGGLPG